jgi:hypothetical protein
MKNLRFLAIALALSLMIGEAYRSWGAARPVAFWMDDMLAGAILIASAMAVATPTVARRAWFTGSWGIAVGMLYVSFFGKVFAPQEAQPGNFQLGLLTMLVGVAFAVSITGFIASILLPYERDRAT